MLLLLVSPGYYGIVNDANTWHSGFSGIDHTSGSGLFMVVDGSTSSNVTVWRQTAIPVCANRYYIFSCWATAMGNNWCTNPAILHFWINGVDIGNIETQIYWLWHLVSIYVYLEFRRQYFGRRSYCG